MNTYTATKELWHRLVDALTQAEEGAALARCIALELASRYGHGPDSPQVDFLDESGDVPASRSPE